jgi:hypothetical protein
MKTKLTVLFLLIANVATAAEQCTKAQGVSVPCAGVVLPTAWAVEGEKCRSVELPKCKLEASAVSLAKDASITALVGEVRVEKEYSKKLEEKLMNCVVPVNKPVETPWYSSGWFLFGSGLVIGAGAVIAGVHASN